MIIFFIVVLVDVFVFVDFVVVHVFNVFKIVDVQVATAEHTPKMLQLAQLVFNILPVIHHREYPIQRIGFREIPPTLSAQAQGC